MSERSRPRVEVRVAGGEDERARRIRGLLLAMAVCDALVVAVVVVGLAAGWPVWALALAALLPLAVGLLATRTAYVLHRRHAGLASG